MNVPTLLTVAVLVGWLATLISAVNLVRIGTPRRSRRSGGRQAPAHTPAIDGARGRSRTDTLLRAADFPATSAFAAPSRTPARVGGLEHAFTVAL